MCVARAHARVQTLRQQMLELQLAVRDRDTEIDQLHTLLLDLRPQLQRQASACVFACVFAYLSYAHARTYVCGVCVCSCVRGCFEERRCVNKRAQKPMQARKDVVRTLRREMMHRGFLASARSVGGAEVERPGMEGVPGEALPPPDPVPLSPSSKALEHVPPPDKNAGVSLYIRLSSSTGVVLLAAAVALALAPRLSCSLALVASPRLQAACSALFLHVRALGRV